MKEAIQKCRFLNGFALKWIAMISMTIDHVGMVLFPQHMALRIIGRLAFPIYCFLLVEGAVHTSDKRRYLGRLLLFALISEVPFDLVCTGKPFSPEYQNVFFTLALGLMAVYALQLQKSHASAYDGKSRFQGKVVSTGIPEAAGIFAAGALMLLAELLNTDYGAGGVLFILLFYLLREQPLVKSAAFAAADVLVYGGVQCYAVFSLIPILCYNGKRGRGMKYLFYIFYPVHLLILYWLRIWIFT